MLDPRASGCAVKFEWPVSKTGLILAHLISKKGRPSRPRAFTLLYPALRLKVSLQLHVVSVPATSPRVVFVNTRLGTAEGLILLPLSIYPQIGLLTPSISPALSLSAIGALVRRKGIVVVVDSSWVVAHSCRTGRSLVVSP